MAPASTMATRPATLTGVEPVSLLGASDVWFGSKVHPPRPALCRPRAKSGLQAGAPLQSCLSARGGGTVKPSIFEDQGTRFKFRRPQDRNSAGFEHSSSTTDHQCNSAEYRKRRYGESKGNSFFKHHSAT